MTPKFTTPCYVRVEDSAKRKEVCEKLQELGYLKSDRNFINLHKIIIARLLYIQTTMAFMDGRFIDCGINTELFLALAGMRSDTDKGQWFVFIPTGILHHYMQSTGWPVPQAQGLRRATATEIVEHFNNK